MLDTGEGCVQVGKGRRCILNRNADRCRIQTTRVGCDDGIVGGRNNRGGRSRDHTG